MQPLKENTPVNPSANTSGECGLWRNAGPVFDTCASSGKTWYAPSLYDSLQLLEEKSKEKKSQ
jgi:hypothetical protein